MTEDFYYRIADDTLYLSSDPDGKFDVSTCIYSPSFPMLLWPWSNTDITKVVIEDRIAPTTCENMFYDCESLTSIEGLENLDTSHVVNMSQMFSCCHSLESLDLSGWDTSHVMHTDFAFAGCKSLESLDLSGWDTSHVTNMVAMIYDCPSLKSINLSSFDTSKVGYMDFMLEDVPSLETLTTSDEGIISAVPDNTNVVDPTAHTGRDATSSLEATISQFSATADALQASVTALQGNIADMRETLGSDPR